MKQYVLWWEQICLCHADCDLLITSNNTDWCWSEIQDQFNLEWIQRVIESNWAGLREAAKCLTRPPTTCYHYVCLSDGLISTELMRDVFSRAIRDGQNLLHFCSIELIMSTNTQRSWMLEHASSANRRLLSCGNPAVPCMRILLTFSQLSTHANWVSL